MWRLLLVICVMIEMNLARLNVGTESSESFIDKLDKIVEKLDSVNLESTPVESKNLNRHYAKINKLNTLNPIRYSLTKEGLTLEEEQVLSAMEQWGAISPEELGGLANELLHLRSHYRIDDDDDDDDEEESLIDDDMSEEMESDYPMDANEGMWDSAEERSTKMPNLPNHRQEDIQKKMKPISRNPEPERPIIKQALQPTAIVTTVPTTEAETESVNIIYTSENSRKSTSRPGTRPTNRPHPLTATRGHQEQYFHESHPKRPPPAVDFIDPVYATNQRPKMITDDSMTAEEKLSLKRAALLHMGMVVRGSKCATPQPRWLPIKEMAPSARIIYMPPCVRLHRCMADTGCCDNGEETCGPTAGKYTAVPLYTKSSDLTLNVVRMVFYNHTQCGCLPKNSFSQDLPDLDPAIPDITLYGPSSDDSHQAIPSNTDRFHFEPTSNIRLSVDQNIGRQFYGTPSDEPPHYIPPSDEPPRSYISIDKHRDNTDLRQEKEANIRNYLNYLKPNNKYSPDFVPPSEELPQFITNGNEVSLMVSADNISPKPYMPTDSKPSDSNGNVPTVHYGGLSPKKPAIHEQHHINLTAEEYFLPGRPSRNIITIHDASTVAPTLEDMQMENLKGCTCPGFFNGRLSDKGSCICVCDWPEFQRRLECLALTRGKEHFGMKDRVCVANGVCTIPTCQYGQYNKEAGRCPMRRHRRYKFQWKPSKYHSAMAAV